MQHVSLTDKYELSSGRVYLNGMQALVRMLFTQAELDARAGLRTAGFVSGYRGSPVGGFDKTLWAEKRRLEALNITFQPGLNEDLAATAIWGSQLAGVDQQSTVQGAYGLWYGKGPGVDRSMDALKHANAAGVSRYGGVVAVAGDDHGAFSSSLAHQSDHMFIGAAIPILYPATLQDVVDFGVYGWAMSRFTGCWIGLKLVSEVAETSRVIEVSRDRHVFASPSPAPDVQIRWPDPPLGMEQRLLQARLPAVAAFSSANPIDKIEWKTPSSELGVIAAGKTYLDVREAFNLLGIGERQARRLGLAIYKPGLIWPLNTSKLHDFTSGLRALYVIEEKRPVLWDQVITSLYGRAGAPDVVGAASAGGPWATPDCGVLNPTTLAQQIGRWLLSHAPDQEELRRRLADIATRTAGPAQDETPPPPRLPFYCAGCPHNTGTSVPEGATAMAGIGCHGMAAWIPSRNIESMTHMGGEGMHWLGRAPFTEKRHIFQNVGDGTYAHSASLNIRAAVAAGANITFKILYNEAVAMTGGQPVEAGLSVAQICELVQAEDVAKVCVVTDDMERFRDGLPAGVRLAPRTELEIIQRDLQETQGVSVLVYAQGCAAEKRRKRKRGLVEDPAVRVMINEMVCEGCGDCGRKSNCVAIQPLETEYGRKRTINQSACNKDVSCVRGFCPSFITIEGGVYTPARQALDESWRSGLPLPASLDLRGVANIAMAGVGGTGVVTVAAIVGMAAHISGHYASVLDVTGLAQKNGAVFSHIRFSADKNALMSARIPAGAADVILGFDLVAAAGEAGVGIMHRSRTKCFVNSLFTPSADFISDADGDFRLESMRKRLDMRSSELLLIDAGAIAERTLGDAIFANLLLLGAAWQSGAVPLSLDALDAAIQLNGASVDKSRLAFDLGRLAITDSERLLAMIGASLPSETNPQAIDLIERRAAYLKDYQNKAYADDYRTMVNLVQEADKRFPERGQALTQSVARALFKHMAYKDEYEVARLHTRSGFLDRAKSQFQGRVRLYFHMAPPLLSRRDKATGEPRKIRIGGWITPALRIMASMKGLRGGPFDVFGYTEERRWERALVSELTSDIREIAGALDHANYEEAVAFFDRAMDIKGYGHIKRANAEALAQEQAARKARILSPEKLENVA